MSSFHLVICNVMLGGGSVGVEIAQKTRERHSKCVSLPQKPITGVETGHRVLKKRVSLVCVSYCESKGCRFLPFHLHRFFFVSSFTPLLPPSTFLPTSFKDISSLVSMTGCKFSLLFLLCHTHMHTIFLYEQIAQLERALASAEKFLKSTSAASGEESFSPGSGISGRAYIESLQVS